MDCSQGGDEINLESQLYETWAILLKTSSLRPLGHCQDFQSFHFFFFPILSTGLSQYPHRHLRGTSSTPNSGDNGVVDIPTSPRSLIMILTYKQVSRKKSDQHSQYFIQTVQLRYINYLTIPKKKLVPIQIASIYNVYLKFRLFKKKKDL